MKPNFYGLLLVFINILTLINIVSCATNGTKWVPEYDGVDPKLQKYVDEYKKLAEIQGIKFKKDVTIGFKKINSNIIAGLTTYGMGFREIDVDQVYFNNSTETTKRSLMLHELGHAYCTRDHDHDNGIKYPKTRELRIKEAEEWQKRGGERPRIYEDGCPKSFMYPSVLDDDCVTVHNNDYIKEMFNRCIPW
jgi:hypothetical protein